MSSRPVQILDCEGKPFLRLSDLSLGRYNLLNPDGSAVDLSPNVPILRVLGGGGFGAVVRAVDPLGIPRAIKLVKHNPSPSNPDDTDLFEREVRLTNAQTFKHVIAFFDYDKAFDVDHQRFGFFVSHFVLGGTLLEFNADLARSYDSILEREGHLEAVHDQILLLVSDLLSALVELHHARVLHMDLKPANVLISPTWAPSTPIPGPAPGASSTDWSDSKVGQLRAFVIDLGGGKPLDDDADHPTTPLFCTPYWFPTHMLQDLGFASGRVRYDALRSVGPSIDIFSAGRILEFLFLDRARRRTPGYIEAESPRAIEERKEAFWKAVFCDDFLVVEGIIDRMVRLPRPEFTSASEAKLAFETVPLKTARDILASAALTDRYPGLRIRTGSSLVRVSFPFHEIINHPAFQRLKRLQQLAFVSEIFPDGTHTRFTHSIRTFDLAKQFVWGLNRKSRFRLLFERRHVDQLLVSALLHDIGHYPFAHSVEDLRKIGTMQKIPALEAISHDQEQALKVLAMRDGSSASIAEILVRHGISVDDFEYIISKEVKDSTKSPVLNVSRDILSGVIDVDRVSYLTHDSERTGVPYGGAVDVSSLIEALTVKWEPGSTAADEPGLGIEEGGVGCAEAVLTAVYWMYRSVYWHHTNRAFMAATKYVLQRLLLAKWITFQQYWESTYGRSDWHALDYLRDTYNSLLAEDGSGGTNPLDRLASRRRLCYRRVLSVRPVDDGDAGLYDSLVQGITPEREEQVTSALAAQLPGFVKPKPGEILLDVPLKRRLHGRPDEPRTPGETVKELGTKAKVWVCCRSPLTKKVRNWEELATYSLLAGRLGQVEAHSARKARVFFSTDLLDRIPRARWGDLEDNVREWLRSALSDWQQPTRP